MSGSAFLLLIVLVILLVIAAQMFRSIPQATVGVVTLFG